MPQKWCGCENATGGRQDAYSASLIHKPNHLTGRPASAREPRATPLTHHWVQPLPPTTPAAHASQHPASTQPLRKPNSCSINRSPNIAHLFANSTSTTCALFSQKSRPDRSAGSAGRRTAKLRESARLLQNRSALARPAKLPSLVYM
jgi:hypothetical protein